MSEIPEIPVPPLTEKIQQQFVARAEAKGAGRDLAGDVFAGILPKEGELPDVIAGIDLASAKGKEFVVGLFKTGDYWMQRVEEVGRKLMAGEGHGTEVQLLGELRNVVAEVVPTEMAARIEIGEVDELALGIREYVGDRVLARLTDPAQPIIDRGQFQRIYGEEENNVRALLGAVDRSSPLYKASIASPEKFTAGSVEYIQAQRAMQRVYTETVVARYLQGLPVQIKKTDRYSGIQMVTITRPEAMTTDVAERYAIALASHIDALDQDVNFTPEQYQTELRQQPDREPIIRKHEQFTSRLFDGLEYDQRLPLSSDLNAIAGTYDNEQITSFVRGVATRVLVEGGDIETYLTALSTIPLERQRMASIARQMWEATPPDSAIRPTLSEILLTAHDEELNSTGSADLRSSVVEAMGGEKKIEELRRITGEKIVSGLRGQIETTSILRRIDGYNRSNPLAKFLQAIREGSEGDRRESREVLAKQMIFGQVVSDIAIQHLQPIANEYIAGRASLADVAKQAGEIQQALAHLDLLGGQKSGETVKLILKPYYSHNGYGERDVVYEVPQEMRPLVVQANFVLELLEKRGRIGPWQYLDTIGAYFQQAQEFGVDKKALITLHNQIALSLVTANGIITQRFGSHPYRPSPLEFTDVLIKLGQPVTGARAEYITGYKGFTTYESDGRNVIDGYWVYSPAEEKKDQWIADYLRKEQNSQVEGRVRSGLEPLLNEAVKLAEVRRLLTDEQSIIREDFLSRFTDEAVKYRPDQEFQGDEGVRKNAETAAQLAQTIVALEADIQGMEDLQDVVDGFRGRVDMWVREDYGPAMHSLIEKGKYRLGLGEVARKKKAIEAEMRKFTGKNVVIGDSEEERKALQVVRQSVSEKRGEEAQRIARRIGEIMGRIISVDKRVDTFLTEQTTPPYDPENPDQVVEKLKIPSSESGGQRFQSKEVDLATHDFGPGGYAPGRDLTGLFNQFIAREEALTKPIRDAIDGLARGRWFSNEAEPLETAIQDTKRKLGDKHSASTVLASSLRTLIARAIGAKLDQFDITTLDLQSFSTVAGEEVQRVFQEEIDRLKQDLEARKRTSSA